MFDLKDCVDHPGHVKLDLCHKDDIAACSGISDFKQNLKQEIKIRVSRVVGESMYGVHAVMGVAISPGFASARVKAAYQVIISGPLDHCNLRLVV